MPVWAAISDVTTITGVTVTQPELDRAHNVIEVHVARTQNVPTDTLSVRDLYWLKLAVAYQVVWLQAQPDFFTRVDVVTLLQDGVEARNLPLDALTLAPMARRALRRLSWRKIRSTRIVSDFERAAALYPIGGPVKDYPGEDWEPLE